ncbi:hypothetical protein BSKO_06893 [Bryopsis sp. KO-2023]|nr:hypothetical protein BSKO_06893 [Bryopsis sp. KO-2023]
MTSTDPTRVETGSVASIGELLLRGWTMLAQSCDDCRVPLMQDPQSGGKLCVNCQKTTHDSQEGSSARDEGLTSSRRQKSEDRDEDQWDERLGPFSNREGGQSERPTSRNGGFQQLQQNVASQSTADTNSEKLAVKMTQGWTLTSIFCPRCTTPLVRNREKSLFCVGCDLYTIPQGQGSNFAPPGDSLRSSQKRTKLASSPDGTSSPGGTRLATAGEPSRGQFENISQRSERMELDEHPPARVREHVEMDIAEQGRRHHMTDRQKSVRETLLEKMEEAKNFLHSTPASQVDLCLKYVNLIGSCWETAQKLSAPTNMDDI